MNIKTFKTVEECEINNRTFNFNKKYNNFKQFIFTCGDKDDLKKMLIKPRLKYKIKKNKININKMYISNNIDDLFNKYPHYKDYSEESYRNTLKYLFYKIKFGIYVKIIDNKLKMFIPFNNQNFINNWYHLIKLDTNNWSKYNYKKFVDIYKKKPNKNLINFEHNKNKWDIDNCALDTRKKRNYKLINASYYIYMFNEVCKHRTIPDIEFFINHRDFPVLKKDYTQPYNHLYNSDFVPLEKKYINKKFLPITSVSKKDNFMDILLPTVDDWEIVNQTIHAGMCRDQYINFESFICSDWTNKIPTAVFRGAATDCGYDESTSIRYLIHKISKDWENNNNYNDKNKIDNIKFLDVKIDAGITRLWFNDIKLENDVLHYPKQIKIVERIEFINMSKYKYILNLDGSVTAFRLSAELNYLSVILKVESEYYIWYSKYLEPYVHYIPIKKDFSDLAEKIKWLKENDKQAYQIALNAREFYKKYINKEYIMDYIQNTLNIISSYQ
jgi:hypothetical protein